MKLLALTSALLAACSPSWFDTPDASRLSANIQLSLSVDSPKADSGGVVYTLTATATATKQSGSDALTTTPIAGVALTFTTNATGVVVTPATTITGPDGTVVVAVVVPLGTEAVASVSSADGGYAKTKLGTIDLVDISKPSVPASTGQISTIGSGSGSSGYIYPVSTTITAARMPALTLSGLAVSFSQIGVSSNNNPFAPTMVITDTMGTATSYVFVPNLTSGPGTLTAEIVAAGKVITFSVPN